MLVDVLFFSLNVSKITSVFLFGAREVSDNTYTSKAYFAQIISVIIIIIIIIIIEGLCINKCYSLWLSILNHKELSMP